MASQSDSNINDFAYDFLRNHYASRFGSSKVLIDKDELTRHGHTVQGLFSLKKQDNSLFVAALHTQHSPQIAKALVAYKKGGLSVFRYATALLGLAAVSVAGWQLGFLVTGLVAAVVLAASAFALHTYLEKRLKTRYLLSLLNELKKTQADEQWLGISVSSLTFRHNYLAKQLLAACERRGIGIITVGQRAKVVLLKEPRPAVCRRGDFLSHYQSEGRIRKALLGDTVLRVA